MRKTHLTVLAVATAVAILAIGAVAAYAGIASDSRSPSRRRTRSRVTGTRPPSRSPRPTTKASRTSTTSWTATLCASATIDGKPLNAAVAFPTAKDATVGVGTHTLKYWAQDINGNVEAQQALTFEIVADTVAPVTSATAVSVVRGRKARLRYRVNDADPNKGTATVVIKIKNRSGKVVRTIRAGSKSVNVDHTTRFRCRFKKGVYRYYVYATDAAGNARTRAGSARLTVR